MSARVILVLICLAIDIAIGRVIYKMLNPKSEEDQESKTVDSIRMQKEVHELNEKMHELEALENMMIDLRLCKPTEVIRAFRMEWQGTDGIDRKFDFIADGQSASSNHLLELASAEREQLNSEIMQRIYDLYAIATHLTYDGDE